MENVFCIASSEEIYPDANSSVTQNLSIFTLECSMIPDEWITYRVGLDTSLSKRPSR